jgi:hypothetical protein
MGRARRGVSGVVGVKNFASVVPAQTRATVISGRERSTEREVQDSFWSEIESLRAGTPGAIEAGFELYTARFELYTAEEHTQGRALVIEDELARALAHEAAHELEGVRTRAHEMLVYAKLLPEPDLTNLKAQIEVALRSKATANGASFRLSLLVRIALPYKTTNRGLSAGILRYSDSIEYGAKATAASFLSPGLIRPRARGLARRELASELDRAVGSAGSENVLMRMGHAAGLTEHSIRGSIKDKDMASRSWQTSLEEWLRMLEEGKYSSNTAAVGVLWGLVRNARS